MSDHREELKVKRIKAGRRMSESSKKTWLEMARAEREKERD
jgi:hypothetical protein